MSNRLNELIFGTELSLLLLKQKRSKASLARIEVHRGPSRMRGSDRAGSLTDWLMGSDKGRTATRS